MFGNQLKHSLLNQALAVINLINLGFAEHDAIRISGTWVERQFRQSLAGIGNTAQNAMVEDVIPHGAYGHRLFVSFHYSIYPLIYRALAARCERGVVYSLIGQQDEQHRVALNSLAAAFNFHVNFIESTPTMVRQLRSAIRTGAAGIILVDLPWSKTHSELDVTYPVPGGHFRGRSSLERLVRLIDENYHFVTAFGAREKLTLTSHGSLTLSEAFSWLGRALQESPADYERLHQLHKFFEFKRPRDCVVAFTVRGDHFAIHGRTMKAWQIKTMPVLAQKTPHVTTDASLLYKLKEVVRADVESAVFL